MKYFADMFKRTFDFHGKSNLKEFWIAVLFYILFGLAAEIIALPFVADFNIYYTVALSLSGLYEVILFLPMLSLTIRRLHDAGYSGFMLLLSILPLVGTIIVIYFLCQSSVQVSKVQVWGMPNQNDEQVDDTQTDITNQNNQNEETKANQFDETTDKTNPEDAKYKDNENNK